MKSKNKVLLSIFVKLKSYPSSFLYGTPSFAGTLKDRRSIVSIMVNI